MSRRLHLSLRVLALTLLTGAAMWPRAPHDGLGRHAAAPRRSVPLVLAGR